MYDIGDPVIYQGAPVVVTAVWGNSDLTRRLYQVCAYDAAARATIRADHDDCGNPLCQLPVVADGVTTSELTPDTRFDPDRVRDTRIWVYRTARLTSYSGYCGI